MDEATRKKLEELHKKVVQEVPRKANGPVEETSARGGTPETGKLFHKQGGKLPPPLTKEEIRAKQMQELKARVRRREAMLKGRDVDKKKKKEVAFVVYHPNHFRAKQIGAYVQRMGFPLYMVCSDLRSLIRSVLDYINDPDLIRTVFAVEDDQLQLLKDELNSEELAAVRQRIPGLTRLPVFVFLAPEKPPLIPKGMEPKWVLPMRQNPTMNAAKVKAALEIRT